MYQRLKQHLPQFGTYLLSGGSAAAIELGTYKVLLVLGVPVVFGAFLSGCFGLLSAFVFHKYFVFKKKEKTMNQVIRYALLQTWNLFAQTVIVYVLTTFFAVDPIIAKILGIGATVSWNFFLYKFLVYV